MDLRSTIIAMIAMLLFISFAAILAAAHFGNGYKIGGDRKKKYICVGCSVAALVCLITAVQIGLMFRALLFGA